ncbi:glyoxylase-like metal-dependent hydrolase (beta-lactamase superfamily II) [Haloactinopolyspora alba]|uniref:Glyoxylase-like metal-dependent hydrolase (Beta-lactamase superfamily II) n=1 Tax=Haloactinopolyspora alba TaxID=648780 RepID=A0A2P8E7C1_9ACTN|nr:MBL fold metallo-hydrolase [Haloactinopolyspora alba]PSL05370.1 glyoxylase-like metal-dependent hydrolase (beta-lactamase superfamily II) [Haloactinopolyspora alba]
MTDAPSPLPAWCRSIRADNPGPMTLDGTNTYVISTDAGAVVVDPGPAIEEHLSAVAAAAGPVVATVLTHRHDDHTGGAHRFRELTGAPLLARDPAWCVDGALPTDGATFELPGPRLRVVDTPGHTSDSICVVADDGTWTVLFSGDTVLGRGTTVVAHPDGDLGAYLDSLRRLETAVGPGCLLLPGHGPVRDDAAGVIGDYIVHRHQRLDEVRSALAAGARTARDVVEVVYADVDRAVWPAAELTVRAALEYLDDSAGR